jgi:hydrogenase-4 component B
MAVACFTKAYGAVFQGLPRSPHAERGHDPGAAMVVPMAVLGFACIGIGLAGPALAFPLDRAIAAWSAAPAPGLAGVAPLGVVAAGGLALYVAVGLLAVPLVRAARRAAAAPTWDCGYAAPTARMEYTASSFAQFPLALLSRLVFPVRRVERPAGPFPGPSRFESHVPEPVLDRLLAPAVERLLRVFTKFRWLQSGSIQPYLAYLLLTLVAALVWVAVRGTP